MRARLLLPFLAVLVSTPRAQDIERTDPERLCMQVERALDAPPRNWDETMADGTCSGHAFEGLSKTW